jgi:anaerobic magnesium-protoporphyrin IX monomethyl ester cyclase
MKMDCLLIGFNDWDFQAYVDMVKSMGSGSGAYKDLSLAFMQYEGKPWRSMDILNRFYFEGTGRAHKPFHNADFLWPVTTYLSTYLWKRGFNFDYVNLFHLEKERLKEKLIGDEILAIAVTTTLYVSPHPIIDVISFIRAYNTTAKIIVGGPYISNQKKEDFVTTQRLYKYLGADIYVTCQEGELALVNTVAALKENTSLDAVGNIAYKKGNGYVVTSSSIESNPLEENMVDYTLFPREEIGEFVTLRTAKSCPFSCAFCGFPARAGKYKYLDVEHVEQELNAIREIGTVTTVTFIDDTFNVPKARFKEMLRMMIRNQYGLKWNCFYRSDHGDEEAIELMGEAGCEGVFLGVESGSDAMLERMNKTARRKDYRFAIPLLRDAGISTYASLIIGFPGETNETVQETIDFIEESQPDFFRAQLWYCDPLTPIWEEREKYSIKGSGFSWSHRTMDSEMACDLIDRIFLCVDNSIWLPQFGFEQWSTFYLQRKGMSLDRIRTFLKCFNSTIKERLIYSDRKDVNPGLLNSLRTSCKFDQPDEPDISSIEAFSGGRYLTAESFWIDEFAGSLPSLGFESPKGEIAVVRDRSTIAFDVARSTLDPAAAGCHVELSTLILAAYSILISHVSGQADTPIISIVSHLEDTTAVPMRLFPSWGLSFKQFAQTVQRKCGEAVLHQLYAFHILTNPLRMARCGQTCPVFDAGFLFCDSERQAPGLEESLKFYRSVSQGIGLVIKIVRLVHSIRVQFLYADGWFTPQSIEKISSHFASILAQVCESPEASLGDVASDVPQSGRTMVLDSHVSESFKF